MSSHGATVVGWWVGKPLLIGLAGLMLSAGASYAQTTGQGTFVGGAGAYSNGFSSGPVLQIGGGGQALIRNRFGIGGELGLAGGGGDAWATVSLTGSLHFPKQGATNGVVPFVSGGYTRMAFFTESGGSNALNIGGGVTYWVSDRKGLLVEFRDVVYQALGIDQYWAARIGITFRSGGKE
jgi:hypothetical protein